MSDLSALPGYHRDYQMLTSQVLLASLHMQDQKNTYTEEDFPNIRQLCLQNMNICTVSNISDFTHLAKLVLSNNAIERLTGLDYLVNLEVLDVSFNKLRSLDGVEKLVRLLDLSANNNEISDISGLLYMSEAYKRLIGISQASHPLQLLNLQCNALAGPLKQTIRVLQSFKALRILVLLSNEFSREGAANLQLYRKEALAFLPSLKYLDFCAILPDERQRATDAYKTELIALEERSQLEAKALQQALTRARYIRVDAAADCLGFDNMVDAELLTGDANEKIFLIPAVKMEAVGWFRTEAIQYLRNFARVLRRRRVARQGEICEFEEFYQVVTDDLAGTQRLLLHDYYWRKYRIINGYYLAPAHNPVLDTAQPKEQTTYYQESTERPAAEPDLQQKSHNEGDAASQASSYRLSEPHDDYYQLQEEPNQDLEHDAPEIDVYEPNTERSLKELMDEGGDLQVSDLVKKFDDVAPLKPLNQQQKPTVYQPAPCPVPKAPLSIPAQLVQLLDQVKSQILAGETEVYYEIYEGIDQLGTALQALQNKTVEVAYSNFYQFKALLNQLNEKVSDLLHKALELKLWKEAYANAAKEEVYDTIAEAVDLTLQDQGAQQQQQQEVQNLLPAEMTPQVLALLKDKASIATAAMNAHEHKSSLIDVREDTLIASQKESVDNAMKVIQGCEFERIRRRMLEIEEWYLREKEFAEKAAL